MSARGSQFVAGTLICAVGLVFAATAAQSERVRGTPTIEAPTPAAVAPVAETHQQRRQRLNAKIADMLQSGEGGRLTQPTAAARPAPRSGATPRRTATPRRQPSAQARRLEAVLASTDIRSTIAPPPYTGGTAVRAGRGYTAPRLDLTTPPRIPTSDVECLTQAIYYEARNESVEGQAAVAEVVLNRSRSGTYPRSVCAVVYQRNTRTCQFTFTCDGAIGRSPVNMTAWARAERIAREVYEGRSAPMLPANSVNYHANYVRPTWGSRLERVRQIGAHIFYGAALGGRATPGAERAAPVRAAPQGLQFVRIAALDRAVALAAAPPATPPAS